MAGVVINNGILVDCDANGIPDECDLSCTGLGGACATSFPGDCGLADDCDANGQPDACDLVGNDCNGNGIPDTCEGPAPACNDGNACTVGDHCEAGVCVGAPMDCHALDSTCVVGTCNPANGQCRPIPANTGGACDDGVPCTHDDFCWNGACVGFEPDCSALDDACNVGVCDPDSGECTPEPVNDGGLCDDGNLCTANDTCLDGVCAGTPPDCSALDSDCTVGVCDPASGQCTVEPANEGGGCDDGNACSVDDFCSNGVCVAFEADCSGYDDACNVGVCNPVTGLCDREPINEGGACDDGNGCTENDTCSAGVCGGTPKDCSALDGACVSGVCLGTTGICTVEPFNEGGACDDGDACTGNDTCAGGLCAGAAVDCSGLTDACNDGACIGSSGLCAAVPANEGGTCDDGDLCTINDSCAGGVCAGEVVDCSALDSDCTLGVCDPDTGACMAVAVSEGGACDDGDGCTVNDACVSGACVGELKDCSALEDACNLGACIGTSGVCAAVPANDGGACDDGDACTGADTCLDGVCAGDAVDCSGLDDACNIGVCAGTSGLCEAQPVNEGGTCDDGELCTVNDSCAGGTCAGVPVDCSALDDACNVGVCDPATGACVAEPRFEGGGCDDGDPCTVNDTCSVGVCAGEPLDCSVLDDACNVGVCDANSGTCVLEPRADGTACDDGNGCTDSDACTSGVCAGVPKDCSAADDACHVGACIGTTGVCTAVPANDGGACDDGDACTAADACNGGVCAGAAVDCTALDDACNIGVCVGSNGACAALPTNEAGTCDDDDLCTVNDTCSNGACAGTAVDCSALDDACHIGVCDPATGGCVAIPANEGGACDDGDGCTVGDACNAGICSGVAMDCSALDDTCNTGVCVGTTGVCVAAPANEGGACDDGDGCTVNDACGGGTCAGAHLDCSGLDDACNIGTCDPATGACVALPANEGGACDDGDPCTVDDVCGAGTCAGVDKDCSGLDNACNKGTCNALTGACEAAPAYEGEVCDDGNACTVDDACAAGVCTGAAKDCSGLDDACNIGVCVGTSGVCALEPANDRATCDDGNGCTVDDACSNGVCRGAPMPCGYGMTCDEARAECVLAATAPPARVGVSQKGSLLIFPKVELRWDSGGSLLQDTFLALTNDYPDRVIVQMYFVNGDPPADAVTAGSAVIERSHPGWNHIDAAVTLTANQPTYWSAATGTPIAGGVPPWTILDPGTPPGRIDPDVPGERMLRGYVVAWAVDALGREVRWNHVSGSATVVDYGGGAAWEYAAYALQIRDSAIPNGGLSGTPGELHLDGTEYDPAFDLLEFAFWATGYAPLGPGATSVAYDTDMTLLPISMDLRQETGGPVTTKASLTVWNENEVKLTGLDRCVTCWDEQLFSNYGLPNHLVRAHLQTDLGRAQIDGLASQVCNHDFDPGDGLPLGGDPRDVVSKAAALGGVAARQMCFSTFACDTAGATLGGAGTEGALILVDFLGSPPPERSGGDN